MTLKRVLLPTDFSDTADHTLGYAREMAERFGAEVHVLHVVADPTPHDWRSGRRRWSSPICSRRGSPTRNGVSPTSH